MPTGTDHNVIETDDITILDRLRAPEIFAEGMTQILVGYPNTRVVLYTLVAPKADSGKEVRRAVATVTMPTTGLVEMAKKILEFVKANEKQILEFHATSGPKIEEMLASFEATGPDGGSSEEPPAAAKAGAKKST